MKAATLAPQQKRQANDVARCVEPPTEKTAQLVPARDPARPNLLDHLRHARLAERWKIATEGPAEPLPGRADLERRFGTSLRRVRVHTGPAARSLLDHLGARGAASGNDVLLRDPGEDRATVAHEVTHVLQSQGEGDVSAPLSARHPAEREAERIARRRGRARVRVRLRPGTLALRRILLRPREPAGGTRGRVLGLDELARPPDRPGAEPEQAAARRREQRLVESAPRAPPEGEAPAEPTPVEEQPQRPAAEEAGPVAAREEAPAVEGAAEPAPDRRAEVEGVMDDVQETWDEAAEAADTHEVQTCPAHASQPGTQPFARGPPLDVPAVRERVEEPDPELEEPVTEDLRRAQSDVQEQLDRVRARGPPVDTSGLDEAQRSERDAHRRELNRRIADGFERNEPRAITEETIDRTGSADPARANEAAQALADRARAAGDAAREGTREDFGEERLAPQRDPTEGHDSSLDELAVPTVDIISRVPEERLQRVATDGNAGQVAIDEVVLVQDQEFDAARLAAEAQEETQARVDREIFDSERSLAASCRESGLRRDTALRQGQEGVAQRRGEWTAEADSHVGARTREGESLKRGKLAHAEQLESVANERARRTVSDARTDADRQRREARRRAETKARQTEDRSWWQQGIDYAREVLAGVVEWIDGFIDGARRAIDAMLDAAAALAHSIVEGAHRAISATLDGLRQGLDFIADNLPGELGEIANRYRSNVHDLLDGVQSDVDQWAEDLHQHIDETIEDLREDLHDALDELQEGVHDVADALDDILENGLMPWLRAQFPTLAALIDEGLIGPVTRASEKLGEWIEGELEATGLTGLQRTMEELHDERFCQAPTEQEQAEACAAFEAKLEDALDKIDEIMESPIAQEIQSFLQESQEAEAEQQVSAIDGFLSFISWVARPVYEWWQAVQPMVESALDTLGEIASTIWRHIASALGIDINLSPLEALQQGLEALWEAVTEATAPLVQALRDAWNWVRNDSILAPIIDFFAQIPELWNGLKDLWNRITQGVSDWFAQAAEVLSNTILPAVNSAMGAVSRALNSAIDQVQSWGNSVLGVIDAILSWEAGIALVDAIVSVLAALVSPIRLALRIWMDCMIAAWRFLADKLRDIVGFLRMLADLASGLILALATMPLGFVMFFAGNVWLHVIPDCYKAPLLNFILDVAIRFIEFFPEPADFRLAILYQGLLNFLQGLRDAPDAQKVGAVNLFASIFAGNAEFLAGFAVGLVEGVWESTVGTVIFLLQAVVWLLSLPFKLARWAVQMLTGQLTPEESEETDAGGPPAEPESELAPELEPEPQETTGATRVARRLREAQGGGLIRDGPEDTDAVEEIEEEAEIGAEVDDELTRAGLPADGDIERERPRAPETLRLTEDSEEPGSRTSDRGRTPESDVEPDADEGSSVAPPLEEPVSDEVPEAPGGLSSLHGILQRVVTEGFTREDIQQAMDGARAALRGMVGDLAHRAATALLASLNAEGAAFSIGRTMGTIVGMIVVEVLLAIFTGGASAGVTAAKTAITSARVTARFAGVLRRVRRALEPLLAVIQRMKGALGEVLGAIRRWFDDVLRWMRGIARRARGRIRPRPRARRPPTRRPGRAPDRPRAPRRRGDGPDGRRRRPRSRDQLLPVAMAQAKAMSDLLESRGRTVLETLAALQTLRAQYRFIRGFAARGAGPRRRMILFASEHQFDTFNMATAQQRGAGRRRRRRERRRRRRGQNRPPRMESTHRLDDLDDVGLTPAQRQWFRNQIDNAPNPAQADRLRFQRYRLGQAQRTGLRNPADIREFRGSRLSRTEHRAEATRLRQSSQRGRVHEQGALDDLNVPNNNTSNPVTHTQGGITTRPDGVTTRSFLEVKSTGGVQYRTRQIRVQQASGRRHATVITGGPASGVRPSGPLAETSRVLHRDPSSGAWSMWDRASSIWRPISRRSARNLVRFR